MKVREILDAVKPVWVPNKNYSEINPTVTVILPTFRRAKSGLFEKAVESVIAQSYSSWELIIVDDASTDGTEDLIKFYMDLDSRISTVRHTNNMGLPAISEYEGYIKARGQYIAFIFDDNQWEKDHLMSSVKKMMKENVKFTYGVSKLYYDAENALMIGDHIEQLPLTNYIGNGSVVVHRDVLKTIGLYDPHLSLTRLCDWDMWYRISQEYVLKGLGTLSTNELGYTLNDSLGNTVDMNVWVSRERMSYDRRKALIPKNYPDADIIEIKNDDTDFYCDYIKGLYNNYQKKCWYDSSVSFEKNEKAKKRILIVGYVDATYYLSFEKLKDWAVIKTDTFASIPAVIDDAVFADAVIFVRNTHWAAVTAKKIKNSMKRPPEMFFYLDDNFFELSKEKNISKDQIRESEKLAGYLNRKDCKMYSRIIVSTNELKECLLNKNIHDKIDCLPPVIAEEEITALNASDKSVNIGFMGGKFREKVFVDTVFPAVLKIAEEKNVRLICTETLAEALAENYNIPQEIEIVSVHSDPCYTQFINRYKQEQINILIHPGEKIKNNVYKTKNALINAVKLGAVLITSDVPPYLDTDAIITAETSVDKWYNTLKIYAFDEKARNEQYQRQCSYVRKEYGSEKVGDIFTKLLEDVKSCSETEIMDRYSLLLLLSSKRIAKLEKESSQKVCYAPAAVHSVWNPDKIVFSGNITDKKKYFIRTTVAQINKLGVIFTSLGNQQTSGTVICSITDKKHNIIGISRIDIDKIKYNDWTYFTFVNVELPTEFYLDFKFDYDTANAYLGIYENISNRSLVYRAANKFKLPYYGVNVPLIDLSNSN